MSGEPSVDAEQRLRKVASVLQVDALTAVVVKALIAGGVDPIVLKGPAVARWLYDDVGDRQYSDTDLLVSPDALGDAEAILRTLGFRRGHPGWLFKSREWRSERGLVDLHTSFFGVETDDATTWEILAADTESQMVGGITVQILGAGGRALHLVAHAAQHGREFAKPRADLERALALVPLDAWRDAALLAERLGATGTFVAGLRRADAEELLEQLGLAQVRSDPVVMLIASDPPPTALGIGHLAAARTTRERLSLLVRGVAPRPQFMRNRYPVAARGRTGLTFAYAIRIGSLARHLPAGMRAWRLARRPS